MPHTERISSPPSRQGPPLAHGDVVGKTAGGEKREKLMLIVSKVFSGEGFIMLRPRRTVPYGTVLGILHSDCVLTTGVILGPALAVPNCLGQRRKLHMHRGQLFGVRARELGMLSHVAAFADVEETAVVAPVRVVEERIVGGGLPGPKTAEGLLSALSPPTKSP